MRRPLHLLSISTLAAFASLLAGCTADDPGAHGAPRASRGDASSVAPHAAADTTRLVFPDAAPGRLQLPTPVQRALRGALEPWALSWRLALPTLRLDQFARGGTISFAAEEATPYDGTLEGADLRLQHLVLPSPNVLFLADPFLDLDLELTSDGSVRAVHGDEPGVALLDLRAHTERRVLDLPAGGLVDGAHWLDERRVVVLADEPARGGRRPVCYIVDVRAENAVRYAGPVAGAAEAGAARTDLDRRFRAARPALIFASR